MSRYCLDTTAYSQFMRGDPVAVEHIDGAEWLGLPAIVLGELWMGFRGGARLRENERELDQFLANPVVEELIVDHAVARLFGEIVDSLRAAGTPLPTNDIWIAATAARVGATVLTYDDHFARIPRVGCLVLQPS